MSDTASGEEIVSQDDGIRDVQYYKKDFWKEENLKYSRAHYRMQKCARLVNRLAVSRECSLLDVGCGPATLSELLSPHIEYFGIDIAIQDPGPHLLEFDFLESPMRFADRKFDFIVAQGVFEYVGEHQEQKFSEIAELLAGDGIFIASYVNFDHRARDIYWPYSNVRSFDDFRSSLARHFKMRRCIPTSHNWNHSEPGRKFVSVPNMHMNVNVPIVSRILAVEYFFICSRLA
jgi:cyclopropane fatty-acyl-phospholipid synthase-like methyltransferase